ncbi:MAG: DUF6538 domain-containing protein [Pseudomonadota bacterium]
MSIEDPDMKALPGVYRQPNSANWHFQKKVPLDLKEHPAYRGKQWAHRGSLSTSSLREANAKAAQLIAGLETQWATYRAALKVTAPEDVPAALVSAIAQQVQVLVLAEDERLRADPAALAASLAQWWERKEQGRRLEYGVEHDEASPPFKPGNVPRWLTAQGQQEAADYAQAGRPETPLYALLPLLKQRHQEAAAQAREAMSRGAAGPYLLLADSAAMALGINLGPDGWVSPKAQPIRAACQRAYLGALDGLAQRNDGLVVDTPAAPDVAPKDESEPMTVLTLQAVVNSVVADHPENGFKRKVETVTRLMLALLDPAMPVASLKQAHISDFLAKVCRLPTDWYVRGKRGTLPLQLLAEKHAECISPTTFESTYKAGMSTFLKRASHAYGDQGFPRGLGVEFAAYKGIRKHKEDQQRNFKADELVTLFESNHYKALADGPDLDHKYWFPLVSLYTGARPRELCQINPQVDTGERDGVAYLLISAETEADDKVTKSVKTGEARHVPIHPELERLGFLDYLKRIKGAGARRLFPGFGVHKGDAAARAKQWFSGFLDDVELRDETAGAKLTGIYAFRKTFITEAARLGLRFEPITGHAEEGRSKVVRDSYIMEELPLADKMTVMKQVVFKVSPHHVKGGVGPARRRCQSSSGNRPP